MSRRVMRGFVVVSVVIAFALTGCSSGGGSSEGTTATGVTTSAPAPIDEPSVIEVDGTRVWLQCQGA